MSTNYYSSEKRENLNVNLDKDKNMNLDKDKNMNMNLDKDKNMNLDKNMNMDKNLHQNQHQNLNMNRAINQNQLETDLPRENKDLLQHQDRMSDLNRDKDFNTNKDFSTNKDWEKEQDKNWKKDNTQESHGVVGNVVDAAKNAGYKVKDVATDAAHKVKEAFSGDKNKEEIHASSDVRTTEKHDLVKEPLIATDRTTNKERFGTDTTNLNYGGADYDKNKNLGHSDHISTGDKIKNTTEKIKDSAKGAAATLSEKAHDAKESLTGGHNRDNTNFEGKDFSKDANIGGTNLVGGDKPKDANWEMQHKKVIYKEEPASDARYHSTARGQNY